ncbi:MAG: TIGR00266 family protein [Vicingaceae bacterium]|nr:MAG: TIGR00266 family protein [Bacteroidia bacterium]GIV42304.1 MAG: TIGR00266 family protein [Vicingaceae bacterium]
MYNSHEIDYKIFGEEMQCVEIELDPGESVVAEAGSMMMMDTHIEMQTIFGDGSQPSQGFFGKLVSAGKRLLVGESLFMTVYTNSGSGKQRVCFASPYPGKIIPLDLKNYGHKIICQKDAFLCAAKGVSIGIEFQKRIGAGLFGGEGFIMEKIEGDGWAFLHSGGTIIEKKLSRGEQLRVDTGCLVGFTGGIDYDIQFVKGIKNMLFGGEGMFFATLTGEGTVWIQSLPISRLANRILSYASAYGGKGKEEGSILGGLGRMLDGDNY